jgi:hypothetical protein
MAHLLYLRSWVLAPVGGDEFTLCCAMDATEKMRTGYCSVQVYWGCSTIAATPITRRWRGEAQARF